MMPKALRGGEETLPEDAPDTLALDAENLISVQSGGNHVGRIV